MAIVKRGLAAAVLFAGLSPIACGSDSGGSGDKGTGGSGNTEQDSGPPVTVDVPPGGAACGSKICQPPATGTACCADQFQSICGMTSPIGGGCVKAPPPPPKDCPMLPSIAGFQLASCCTSKGECGIDESLFPGGGGCLNYADATAMAMQYAMGSSMFNVTLPPEQNCSPADGGS